MKKYRFRLANVLRVREIQEEQARAQVLLANREVALARNVVRQREKRLAKAAAETMQTIATSSSLSDFMGFRSIGRLAAEGVTYSQVQLDERQEIADEKKFEWQGKKRSVQTLERLDDRRREEHRLEVEREYAKEADDIVVSRYGRDK